MSTSYSGTAGAHTPTHLMKQVDGPHYKKLPRLIHGAGYPAPPTPKTASRQKWLKHDGGQPPPIVRTQRPLRGT